MTYKPNNEYGHLPFLSVCIPSYNRPGYIRELLITVVNQDYLNYEVVICDDNSPLTSEIEQVVNDISNNYHSKKIRFFRNKVTLGYDGNFRNLISKAEGDYCVYMGDDDLLCPGALSRIGEVIEHNPGIGVIIRSWARAERESKKILEKFRYFEGDRKFLPGRKSVLTLFRRSVSIAGYTVNRHMAQEIATNKFDGTLLYQLYLTGIIVHKAGGYYIDECIAIMRKDANQKPTHFFGNAEAEKGRFIPGELSTTNSLNFVKGFIEIAEFLSVYHKDVSLKSELIKDIGNYSYPILSVQRSNSLKEFIRYYFSLKKLGLGKNRLFQIYFFLLLLFGRRLTTSGIVLAKKLFGKTPEIGNIYTGEKAKK